MPRKASVEFTRFHETLDAGKAEAARLNEGMEPGADGKEKTQYRAYAFTVPASAEDRTTVVVARGPQEAVYHGCLNFGIAVEGATVVRVPKPEEYLDLISPDQLAALEKQIRERKKAGK